MSDDRAIEVVAEWLGGDRGWATSIVEALASAGFQITDLTAEGAELSIAAITFFTEDREPTIEEAEALTALRRLSGANGG